MAKKKSKKAAKPRKPAPSTVTTQPPQEPKRGPGRPRDAFIALKDLLNADPKTLNLTGEVMSMRDKAIRNMHAALDMKNERKEPTLTCLNISLKVVEITDPKDAKLADGGAVSVVLVDGNGNPVPIRSVDANVNPPR